MSISYKEKIRSISAPRKLGQSERQKVLNEDNGKVGGEHVVHWDGRQDAIVRPQAIQILTTQKED